MAVIAKDIKEAFDSTTNMVKTVQRYGRAEYDINSLRGYMGISICSHYFSKEKLRQIGSWATSNFSQFLFLIGDDIQAYTFSAFKGLDYNIALQKAREIGDQKTVCVKNILRHLPQDKILILRWRDIEKEKMYREKEKSVIRCYKDNSIFRNDILRQVASRRELALSENGLTKDSNVNIRMAANYVLCEISVMIYLQEYAEPKWEIQVFPLSMPPALLGLYKKKYCNDINIDKLRSGYIQIAL